MAEPQLSATAATIGRYSAWLPSPSGPPAKGVDDVLKRLSQGGQVAVIHPPAVHLGGELDQGGGPRRSLRGGVDRHLFDDGDEAIDLDHPVDDLDGSAPGGRGTGELPGPVATRGRAPLRGLAPRWDEDR